MNVEEISQHVQRRRDEFVQELIAFCRQPSISATGQGIEAMADMVASRLRRLGAKVDHLTVQNSHPYIWAEVGEGPPTLLVYNHYDVQPARREDGWLHDPFAPYISGDRLFARGVADNKANLLFRIHAVDVYQSLYGTLPLKVKFLIEGEEEIGSPHLTHFVARYGEKIKADGCIWESGRRSYDGRPTLHLGVRGILYVELRMKAKNREMHSSWANIVFNPSLRLLERMQEMLSTLTDEKNRPKFGGLLSAVPEPSASDIEMLSRIPFDVERIESEHGLQVEDGENKVDLLRHLLFEPSCNICGVGIGYTERGVKTVIPNRAVSKIDFRLPPGLAPEYVEKALRAHLTEAGYADVEMDVLASLHPVRFPPNSLVARAVSSAVQQTYKVDPIVYPLMPASGPMYELCGVTEIPAITFGAGHPGDNVHGVNENIYLHDYFQALTCFVYLLHEFAGLYKG